MSLTENLSMLSQEEQFSPTQSNNEQIPKIDVVQGQAQLLNIASTSSRTDNQTQKILALQEELLGTRKQMSRRQNEWEKEKSHLLHQIQLDNMEIGEFRQRLSNLSKINQTLTEALSSDTGMEQVVHAFKAMATRMMGEEEAQRVYARVWKNSTQQQNTEFPTHGQQNEGGLNKELKKKVNALQKVKQESNRTISCYLQMINNLESKIASLAHESVAKGNSIIQLERSLEQAKDLMEKKEEEILKCHKQISMMSRLVQEKVALTNRSPQKSAKPYAGHKTSRNLEEQARQQSNCNPVALISNRQGTQNKKKLTIQQLQQPCPVNKKYASNTNSSYLILKPTSDHSMSDQLCNNSSYIYDFSVQDPQSDQQWQPKRKARLVGMDRNSAHITVCAQLPAGRDYQQDCSEEWEYLPSYDQNSQSEVHEEEQRLLCEVCNKVFPFHQFQHHMKSCGYQKQADITELLQRKKFIISELENLKHKEQKQNRKFQNERKNNNNCLQKGTQKVRDSNLRRPSKKCGNVEYANFSIKNRDYGF